MAERPQDDFDDTAEEDTVDANHAIQRGQGVGARELRAQEDPHGSGSPDGEDGSEGVERIKRGRDED